MWYLQRNDVNLRNEWSNYSNWPYSTIPSDLINASFVPVNVAEPDDYLTTLNLGIDPLDYRNTGINYTGDFAVQNQYEILNTMAILLDGEYRENLLPSGVYDYVEKYTRTGGFAKPGIYCYNFCLDTSPYNYQPTGAINLSRFRTVELEITTYVPPIDTVNSTFDFVCDVNGNPIGVRKSNWRLYDYNYNLTLFEERYNVLTFMNGNCGMLYSR